MDGYSKLYCKSENILKIIVNNRDIFLKMDFRSERMWIDLGLSKSENIVQIFLKLCSSMLVETTGKKRSNPAEFLNHR
jgi:hypothetical protein